LSGTAVEDQTKAKIAVTITKTALGLGNGREGKDKDQEEERWLRRLVQQGLAMTTVDSVQLENALAGCGNTLGGHSGTRRAAKFTLAA
jgi:hypothetical protein